MRITVLHLKDLNENERNRLNGSSGGWDSEAKFARYANVKMLNAADAIREAFKLGEYDIVADLVVIDLEDAFEKSNNINSNWIDNKEVVFTELTAARSTSVGDILADPDTGIYYIVKHMGFEEIKLS